MVRTIPERFITRYTAVDRELVDRQWAEWRATRRHLLQIGAFAGAGLALGLGGSRWHPVVAAAAQDEQPKAGGSITMSLADQDVTTFDPPVPPDNMSIWTMLLFYEQLIRVAPDGLSLEPGLAESWEASDDGKTYTFKVREAQFHDGTSFTAEDAAFCIDRAANAEGTPWQFILQVVESTEAPDPRTCVVHLQDVWAPFEADLAMFSASIFPKAAYEEQGDAFFEHPIGTGPFQFVSRTPDVEVVLEKNPNYWQTGVPYLDGVTFKVLQDSNARVLQLQGGELDIATLVPYNQLEIFRNDPAYTVHPENVARIDIASINTTRPPFDDKTLRQAMNYAVNKESIIQNVLFGNGEMATSFLPKMPGRDLDSPGYPYDPEKAKALVAESAGKDGFEADYNVTAGDAVGTQVAQLVAADLAQIGGKINVVPIDGNTLLERLFTTFDFDIMASYYTTDIIDPDELASFAVLGEGGSGAMGSQYNNPEVNALILQAQSETDPEKRQELYNQIQAMHLDDAPFIFLYYPGGSAVSHAYIKNFRILPTGNYRLWEVWRDDI
ncbi:MAG: extracellular solute-binding protein family 5 [Thermomicrobiales bacterium]|nr:extracellular solute-binding protein family 5 [Thermomicrobiales bacterium]